MTKKTLFILKLKVSEALYDYRLTTSIKTNISNLYMFLKAGNFEFYTHILTKKYRIKILILIYVILALKWDWWLAILSMWILKDTMKVANFFEWKIITWLIKDLERGLGNTGF